VGGEKKKKKGGRKSQVKGAGKERKEEGLLMSLGFQEIHADFSSSF